MIEKKARKLLGVPESVTDEELNWYVIPYDADGEPCCGREGCEMCGFNEGEDHLTIGVRWHVGKTAPAYPFSHDDYREVTYYGEDRWEQFAKALRSV